MGSEMCIRDSTWPHRVTNVVCRGDCSRLFAPPQVATTPAALYAPVLTTRSRRTLQGRRRLKVEFTQVHPSVHSRTRNHGQPSWKRIRSSGRTWKRSCPSLARRLASASASTHQAQRHARPSPARLGGAPAPSLFELGSAPTTGLVQRPGRPPRHLERGKRDGAYSESQTIGYDDDSPAAEAPSVITARIC